MMVHITSMCIEIYLENCKMHVYKIDNNITTFCNGKEIKEIHSPNKIKHFDLILHF